MFEFWLWNTGNLGSILLWNIRTMIAMKRDERMQRFGQEMWEWFSRRKRTLPWRDLQIEDDTQRAYMILVSEVMLQQTQVSRVQIIFKRFLEQFPTIQDLAKASNKDVIIAWKGMGYNSRALRLRDAAATVVDQYNGIFPRELEELLAIKGIGAYTASAIRNFAFHIPTPCVDTNIHRIMHRVFEGPEPEKINRETQKKVLGLAEKTLKVALDTLTPGPSPTGRGGAADWHAALMDFGSLTCKKNNPLCEECPMATGICKSAFSIKRHRTGVTATPASLLRAVEPGRQSGGKFIPNRIFRGRIVDVLRDAENGLDEQKIGSSICLDWDEAEHLEWLRGLLKGLVRDEMVVLREKNYVLKD